MHFSVKQLVAFLDDKLSPDKQRKIERHLAAGCRRCTENVNLLKKLKPTTGFPTLEPVPEELSVYAKQVYTRTRVGKLKKKILEIVASLVYDSRLQPLQATLRAIGAVDRQMLFRASNYDIDFRISQTTDRPYFILTGQMLAISATAQPPNKFTCCLKPVQGAERKAPLSELGEFQLENIKPGKYHIVLVAENLQIALATVDIG